MATHILEIRGIKHYYNGRKVLSIPHLAFDKGCTYAVVGPNGSGKTTLLSIMSLILRPTKGEIVFDGRQVEHGGSPDTDAGRSMTMVLQTPYLFNTSVLKNVSYGLRARGMSRRECEAGAREALRLVGLDGFEKRRARELSGGESQLVALARGLAIDPVVLFLDEPTANVDVRNMRRFEQIIERINRERGTTIVLTSHNLSQAYRMAQTVFSLFEGALIPSTMHNLFAGTVMHTDKGPRFISGDMQVWISDDLPHEEYSHITIDPEDIIVSREPFSSSARNLFEGVITAIADHRGRVMLEVRSREVFRVFITPVSLQEMGLTVGSHVYLTFKATSVRPL
ncbi:MAG: ABC transporter ATP-binding protein [bacterium]